MFLTLAQKPSFPLSPGDQFVEQSAGHGDDVLLVIIAILGVALLNMIARLVLYWFVKR